MTRRYDGSSHKLAHEIIMRVMDYMHGRFETRQLYDHATALIEADRQAVRHEERQAIAATGGPLVNESNERNEP